MFSFFTTVQVLDTALHFTYMTIFILALQTNSIAVSVASSNQNNGTANGTAEAEAVIVCRNMEEGTLGRNIREKTGRQSNITDGVSKVYCLPHPRVLSFSLSLSSEYHPFLFVCLVPTIAFSGSHGRSGSARDSDHSSSAHV